MQYAPSCPCSKQRNCIQSIVMPIEMTILLLERGSLIAGTLSMFIDDFGYPDELSPTRKLQQAIRMPAPSAASK